MVMSIAMPKRGGGSATEFRGLSGLKVDFLDPRPEQISIDDIVTGLCKAPRFCGQTPVTYTVAEHSLMVSRLVPASLAILAVFHDATEAYTGDVPKPLKVALGEAFTQFEHKLHQAIAASLGISPDLPPEIKHADYVALATEQRDLLGLPPEQYDVPAGIEPANEIVTPINSTGCIERIFRRRIHDLQELMKWDRGMQAWAA